jgi:ABC-type multidrug transport system ATPase subunit
MGRLGGLKTDAAQKRAKELLDWLELAESHNSKVGRFSAGMKQRLSLGQAMTHQPQLLLLDEPTANLDPDGRMSLIEKLRQLRQEQNITIFVSSHILPELEQLADTVTLIEKGRMVAEDSLRDLKKRVTANRYVLKVSKREAIVKALQDEVCVQGMSVDDEGVMHLTSSDFAALQGKVIEAVTRAGAEMEFFGKEQASLQDVYRQTMGRDR